MPSSSTKIACLLIAMLATRGGVAARTLTLDAERLQGAGVDATRMHLRFTDGDAAALEISAGNLLVAQLGLSGRVDWSCPLARDAAGSLSCTGPVHLRDGDREQVGELAVRVVDPRIELSLAYGGSRVMLGVPFDATAPMAASLQQVPTTWLVQPLATLWPGGEVRSGTVDVTAVLPRDGGLDAEFAGDGASFNTNDGAVSGVGVSVRGHVKTSKVNGTMQVLADARFGAGALRVGTLRIEFPAEGVETRLDARVAADGRWDVDRFSWRDPGALEFEASGVLDTAAVAPLRALAITRADLVFPLAKERYAAPLFAAHGLAGLSLQGRLSGSAEVDATGLRRLAVETEGLELRDRSRGWSVRGLAGGMDWIAAGTGTPTRIGWRAAELGGIAIGAAGARWQSRDGALRLLTPLRARTLGGDVELRDTVFEPFAPAGARASSAFRLHDISRDSSDGSLAAAHLSADGELHVEAGADGPRVRVQTRWHGGEVLAGTFYAKFPQSDITAALDLGIDEKAWRIARFDWNDPGVLEFSATGELERASLLPQSLQLEVRRAGLAVALPRYASIWLSTKGYGEVSAQGEVSGAIALADGKLQRFALRADAIAVHDGGGRFAVDGLDGGVDWDRANDRPETTLGWRAIELFRIPLGAARARLQSRDAAIVLAEPLAVDVLGGQVRLEHFSAQPQSPRGDRYAGSFALAGIEMARVSEAFGWPRFPGNLSGGIPQIEFVGDRIEFHGGLDLYVFDGHLGMSGLALERPFGVAPSLAADVHFENLDLQQVTSAFSFGGISGRLFGTISALRLVDWSPVAFDAWLRTDGGGRMSYKAVDDLTSIGGGGLSAGLQTMALKIFDTFGYRRIGLRCLLRDEVCTMGGIDPLPAPGSDSSGDGYTIVEGAGLPRITIVGHRRQVDWPTLVRRLLEATQGQGPVIE